MSDQSKQKEQEQDTADWLQAKLSHIIFKIAQSTPWLAFVAAYKNLSGTQTKVNTKKQPEDKNKKLAQLLKQAKAKNLAKINLNADEIAYLYSKGIRDFQGIIATNQDFTGMRLRHCFFDSADFTGSNFTQCNCEYSIFSGAILDNTKFFKAKTFRAEFPYTKEYDEFSSINNAYDVITATREIERQQTDPNYRDSYNQTNLTRDKALTKSMTYLGTVGSCEELKKACLNIMSDYIKSDSKAKRFMSRHCGLFSPKSARQATTEYLLNKDCIEKTNPKKILEEFQAIYDKDLELDLKSHSTKLLDYLNYMKSLINKNPKFTQEAPLKPPEKKMPAAAA